MKKNGHLKTQIAVFAFLLTLLKAAEQRAIQTENISFDDVVSQLSRGMDAHDKSHVIETLGKVNPDHYTGLFITVVKALSQGMDAFDKSHVIQAVGKVNPDHYLFLQNFISQNPWYFTYVPAFQFLRCVTSNMTQEELQTQLKRLHRKYSTKHPSDL